MPPPPGPDDPVPADGVDVTVVVVTYRGREFVADCLDSIAAQSRPHRVLVIDNHSDDGTAEVLAGYPGLDVRRQDSNLGFAGAIEVGLAAVTTRWCALLNDDAVAEPGWLAALVAGAGEPGVVAATSRMLLADGGTPRINNLGVALTADGYGYDIGLDQPADAGFPAVTDVFGFSGGAALLDVAAVRAAGGSPTRFFLYYEDTDISWRLRLAGGRIRQRARRRSAPPHSATIGQHGPGSTCTTSATGC